MKQVSNKQEAINRKLRKVYARIDIERDHVCQGCDRSGGILDHSHTIAQKRCKHLHKEELIFDPGNIELMCRDCHAIAESGDLAKMERLNNFDRIFEYIERHDSQAATKIVTSKFKSKLER